MLRPREIVSAPGVQRALALGALVCVAGLIAINLRRAGHTEGDDFALYLRQARSLVDGDMSAVVADNRFSVLNSDRGFSPIAYPWGWPVLLAPFVELWGLEYDRLKLVAIVAYCVWLVLLHGIVRRRLGRVVAFVFVAVFATAPEFLGHTDQLLTEFPHIAAVAGVIWWYDRIRSNHTLLTAPMRDLVVLGALTTLAFNFRRESVVFLVVFGVVQLIDVWRAASGRRPADVVSTVRQRWRPIVTPAAAFAVAAVAFQLLLPTDVLPDNGNGPGFLDDRWGEYPGILADQLGLGDRPLIGVALLVLAAAGAVIGVRRRSLLDTPLLLLGLSTAVVVGTHVNRIERYWFQVTPWVLYFVAVALLAAGRLFVFGRGSVMSGERAERRQRTAGAIALAPLALLTVAHLVVVPGRLADANDFNSAGTVQDGPAHPEVVVMIDAVGRLTPTDSIVAYYRARTMTLLTDRRSFQTTDFERIRTHADYWVQRTDWSFWQPGLDADTVVELGFTEVWASERFVLWSTGR